MASRPRNTVAAEAPSEDIAAAAALPAEDSGAAAPLAALDQVAVVLLADETGHGRLGSIALLDADVAAVLEIEGKARRASAADIAVAPINPIVN